VQNMTGCSERTLNLVLEKLQPFLKGCEQVVNLKMRRVRARQQSIMKKQLHGCVHCSEHVFGPECRLQLCPKCGGRRFNTKGKPHEVVVDFSLVLYMFLAIIICSSYFHVLNSCVVLLLYVYLHFLFCLHVCLLSFFT